LQIPRLREWRLARALTQEELAEKANISVRSVAGYEAGAGAHPGTVRKLAAALDIGVAGLQAAGPKEPPPHSMNELLERAGVADRAFAMSLTEIGEAFKGLSYEEAYMLAREISDVRAAVKLVLAHCEDTPEKVALTVQSMEINMVANLSFQAIAERERGQAVAEGNLDRARRIERELEEVA